MATIYNSQLDAFSLHHKIQEAPDVRSSYGSNGSLLESLGHGLAGSTGAAISNVATYPLDLIITRLQIQRQLRKEQSKPSKDEYKGLEDAARKIYANEGGITGLYTGVLQDTGKTIADSFIFFVAYNFLRQKRIAARANGLGKGLPAIDELGVGFVAGSLTKLITTPIATIVTRKQAAALTASRSSSDTSESGERGATPTTRQIAKDIMDEKGIMGFWSGYSASLVLTLNPTLTFFLFETLKRLLLPRSRRDNPPAAATFLLSAFSKACASSVTYPFSVAKARLQVGAKDEERDEKEVVGHDVKNERVQTAARTTIFSTLLTIAQTEGVQALYEGLPLEIFRAFLSHGITMLVKQALQRFLVKAYYVVSIILTRYKRKAKRGRLAEKAKQSVEYYNLAMGRASERMDSAADAVKAKAYETAEFVAEYVEEDNGEWRDLYGTTGLAKWLDGERKVTSE